MKAYSDIEQSKKLVEILPIESADMCHNINKMYKQMPPIMTPYSRFKEFYDMEPTPDFLIPCWSLAALLEQLHYPSLHKTISGWRCDCYNKDGSCFKFGINAPTEVDACYEMIVKLKENNLL